MRRFLAFSTIFLCFLAACTSTPVEPGGARLRFQTELAVGASPPDVSFEPEDARAEEPADRGLGLTYEIYVRSFQDSDGDGIGDLDGARSRLDHLEAMGVRTVWLMPLFPAFAPSGYDVTDFDRVRAEYGGADALAAFLDDAHARGMRVLLDLPLNHVARTHPWFVAADADASAPERDLFLFADTQWDTHRWFPAEGGGYFYGFFGADLPDLDWTNGAVDARMHDVLEEWLLAGVDGYRLDAVTMLVEADGDITNTPATHALLGEIYRFCVETRPDMVLLAEASEPDVEELASFLGSPGVPEADRVLDFPRRAAMLEALSAGSPEDLLAHLHDARDAGALFRTSPFLSSHDLPRLAEVVPSAAARRLLQVLQLTLPGDPVLYYGEELDLADARVPGPDGAQRAPMPWDASPGAGFSTGTPWFPLDPGYAAGHNAAEAAADPRSLLTLIQDLACVRSDIEGAEWEPVATDAPAVFAYARATDEGRVVVVANLGTTPVGDVRVDVHGGFRALTDGLAGVDAGDGLRVRGLPAYGYALYADALAARCPVAGPT